MTGASDARVIRTPDQRLRVFVSSTLKELAPERLAARGSIERLHLAPVMFELGARPHPPREVYRAYLEQSDVFVGIYWQQYGWIAPDEEISGLEDEYRLASREMPKLVYVKQPAEREERLAGLLAQVRDDDTTSYKGFSTAEELARAPRGRPRDPARRAVRRLARAGRGERRLGRRIRRRRGRPPAVASRGGARPRDRPPDAARVAGRRRPPPAGHARRRRRHRQDAARHRGRAPRPRPVRPGDVRPPRARARCRWRAAGRGASARGAGRWQRPDARATRGRAPRASRPARARQLRAGDRRRVRGRVAADRAPRHDRAGDESGPAPRARGAGVRRRAARPSAGSRCRRPSPRSPSRRRFGCSWTAPTPPTSGSTSPWRTPNRSPGSAVPSTGCRSRSSSPRRASACSRRRRCSRNSTGCCPCWPPPTATCRSASARCARRSSGASTCSDRPRRRCSSGSASSPATSASTPSRRWRATSPGRTTSPGTLLELVDGSLLRQHDVAGLPFFSMLVPVRELAAVRFAREADAAAARRRHAAFYVGLAKEVEPLLRGSTQQAAVERLEAERDNVRAGFRHLIMIGEVDTVADAVWRLLLFWWIRNLLPTAKGWMDRILETGAELTTARGRSPSRSRHGSRWRIPARRSTRRRSSRPPSCSAPQETGSARRRRRP